MFRKIKYEEAVFEPAAVGTTETKALFGVKAGDRVLWSEATILTNSAGTTNSTMDLGDGTDTDGFQVGSTSGADTFDLELGTAGVAYGGTGAFTNQCGGKLYIVDDTIDVVYTTNTGGATNPKVRFRIAIIRKGQ